MAQPVILFVEDDGDIRNVLTESLAEYGYDVRGVASGEEAVNAIEKGLVPDALVTDIRLPGMSGMDVILSVRQRADTEALPCVIVTGYGSKRTAIDAMKLGAVDFLEKPVEMADLVLTLERVVAPASIGVHKSPAAQTFRRRRELRRLFSLRDETEGAFGGSLFGDYRWEMLVEILASELTNEAISVTGAAAASGAAHATALRGVELLEREELVERTPDLKDRRRVWLRLTPKARRAFRNFMRLRVQLTSPEAHKQTNWCLTFLEADDHDGDEPATAMQLRGAPR